MICTDPLFDWIATHPEILFTLIMMFAVLGVVLGILSLRDLRELEKSDEEK
jgi:hypothetical protein